MKIEIRDKAELIRKRLKTGSVEFSCTGKSMHPAIKECNKLILSKAVKIKNGDLIVFSRKNALICHRLILKQGNLFYVKGDNLVDPDKVIKKQDIIGVVKKIKDSQGKSEALPKISPVQLILLKIYVLCHIFFKKLMTLKIPRRLFQKVLARLQIKSHILIRKVTKNEKAEH